jgi:Arc-like DNA binding domain
MPDRYRFLLRLPHPLRDRLVEAAAESGRSLNAELVHRLERSLDPWGGRRRRAAAAAATCVRAVGTPPRRRPLIAFAATAALAIAVGATQVSSSDPPSITPAVVTGRFVPTDGGGLSPHATLASRYRYEPGVISRKRAWLGLN